MDNSELHSKLDNKAPQKSEGDPPPKKPGSKEKGRKRTKTGCLTCRKRRIKCGEERPTCQNCTKSKRQCEGYNQRVVFKDPLNSYRPSLSSLQGTLSGHNSGSGSRHSAPQQQANVAQNPLPIAPKLPGSLGPPLQTLDTAPISSLPPVTSPGAERRRYALQSGGLRAPAVGGSHPPQRPQPVDSKFDTVDRSYLPEASNQPRRPEHSAHYDFNALIKQEPGSFPQTTAQNNPQDWSAGSSSASSTPNQNVFHDPHLPTAASAAFYHSFPTNTDWKPPQASPSTSSSSSSPQQLQHAPSSQPERDGAFAIPPQTQGSYTGLHQNHQGQPRIETQIPEPYEWPVQQSAISARSQGYMLEDEEDPFDVSDDDITMEDYAGSAKWQDDFPDDHSNNDLALVVALHTGQDNQGLRLRSFTSFIDRPDMLATYIPSPQSSPLRDSMTARIFCHFINVTGPSISMFERHPANPSLIFQGQPVPSSQQHIWTYTFPTVALRNPALLHAMLALASLHIAKLQNGPVTAALKHYAIALRRIGKCLSSPTRRGQPATLAAAMLLAFFEVWAADHQKWINHLLGARQLVKEIDFAGMTRYIKSQKVQKRREERMRYYQAQQQGAGHNFYDDRLRYQAYVDDVDENIIGMLMGKKLRYDQFGHVVDDSLQDDGGKTYSPRDLELYETQRDLFWWYCKQDAYQGILGGGKLFMPYNLWSHCPPRAPLGRLNATYGTFDHLVLLMGRVVDFSAKDVKRKRQQMKANGGWRPLESKAANAPSGPPQSYSQIPHQQGGVPPQMPQIPGFSGMMPGNYEPKYPMGFSPTRDSSPQSSTSEELDLEAQRLEAEEEWQDIRNAFSILQDHFGDDFEALGPEFSKPIQTPFGPALQYRTYGIAGIWMNFYLALIALYRAHPSMPPAAMMAAGIAARQTGSFANELGRIAAGIAPDCVRIQEVTPAVGGALIETTMGLFVAGVQYQNAAQRSWTVNRLHDIARLTGWQTAHAVAGGCEKSWVRAAEMGKGPPYTRMTENNPDRDIWKNASVDAEGRGERRFVVSANERAHHALGILGLEEYVDNLDLDDDDENRGE